MTVRIIAAKEKGWSRKSRRKEFRSGDAAPSPLLPMLLSALGLPTPPISPTARWGTTSEKAPQPTEKGPEPLEHKDPGPNSP